jgi:hypothetical protein
MGYFLNLASASGRQLMVGQTIRPRPRCAYALARPKLRAIGFVGAFEAMGEGTVPGECGIMVMAGRVPAVRFQLERSI